MAHGKLRRLVKNFHTAIANVVQTPGFIREECKPAKRLISASEAPGNTRKDEEYRGGPNSVSKNHISFRC